MLLFFLFLALYTSFLTASFFTTSLILLKLTETSTNLSTSTLSTLLLNFFKWVGTIFSIYQYLIYLQYILSLRNQPF